MPTESLKERPWFKSWPVKVTKTIRYPDVPLHVILKKTAKKHPEKSAIIFHHTKISYAELDLLSEKFASALNSINVKKGDRTAIFLPNIPQFIIAYYGALKVGSVVTTISPLYKEREVEYQLCDSEAKTIITLDSLYPIVATVKNRTSLTSIITTSTETFSSRIEQKPGVYSFHQLLTENLVAPKVKVNPPKDLAALQYTGGTTGVAKGAMLTHSNLVANTIAFATWIKGVPAKEVFLTALPLFHIYGMTTSMNVPVSLAATMILLPRFDPITSLTAIQQYKVTVFCGVPTMYAALLINPSLGDFDLTSVRVCISGASSLPPQIQRRFMEVTDGLLAEGYGLTEASPVTHCNPVDKTMLSVRVGSIGLPLPDTDACIFDLETGTKKLKPNEIGELAVCGPQVMKGYWKNSEETELVLRDGWLFTGDIGRIDNDGYFYITDRKKDLIKYKGYSIYPRELEDILYEHPAVKLCTVIGRPDNIVGEFPKAYVMLKEGIKVSERDLIEFVKERVAPYKQIQELEFRNELPISSAGKVLKRILYAEMKSTPASRNQD